MFNSSAINIGLGMFLRDQFSGPSNSIRKELVALNRDSKALTENSLRMTRDLNAGLAVGAFAASRGMFSLFEKSADYDLLMTHVKVATDGTTQSISKLKDQANQMAGDTMYGPLESAKAYDLMALAGYNAQDMLQSMPSMIAGATVSMESLKDVTDITTNVMSMYGYKANQAYDVVNKLTKASIDSKADFLTLGEAISYSGDTFRQLNIPLESSLAWLMQLHDAGIRGSMAGTSAANTMRYLSSVMGTLGGKKQRDALHMLGLSPQDFQTAMGELKSLPDIMEIVAKAAAGKTTIEGQSLLQYVFGVRGKRGIAPILNDIEKFKENLTGLNAITNDPNYAMNKQKEMMESSGAKLKVMVSALERFGIAFGGAIAPLVTGIMGVLTPITNLISRILDTPVIGKFIAGGVTGFILLKGAIWAGKSAYAAYNLWQMRVLETNRMIAASNAQLRASTLSVNSAMIGGGASGLIYNPALFRGTGGYQGRNGWGGMMTSKSQFGNGYTALGRPLGAGAGMGAGMYGAAIGSTIAATASTTARVAGGLGKVLGFLGGPWGMALMFVLPGVINLLTGALKDNTSALKDQGEKKYTQDYIDYIQSKGKASMPTNITQQERENLLRYRDKHPTSNNGNVSVHLNVDGEKKMTQVIKHKQERDLIKTYSIG